MANKKKEEQKKGKNFKPDKKGLLAALKPLEKYGVVVIDCGAMGIKVENFSLTLGLIEDVIVDDKGQCEESERVYPVHKGFKFYGNGDEGGFYLRPFKKP